MSLELNQIQEQQLVQQQQQRLNAQQVMAVRMLEMPLPQFEQHIQTEMDENPALEGEQPETFETSAPEPVDGETMDSQTDGAASAGTVDADRQDELDKVLHDMGSDDRMPSSDYDSFDRLGRNANHDPDADQEERIFGNTESFYDHLQEQVHEQSLTERQEIIMDYLIGSLDGDGLLRKDLAQLSDEIAVREYIDVSEDEIEKVLTILQSFDPAGIGAQSLQQCLLIQIFRKKPSPMVTLMYRVINDCYKDFTTKHWDKICEKLSMSRYTAEEVLAEIRKLNPRPGAALGESMGRSMQQVTPDFTIDTDQDGHISFSLNNGKVPDLFVSHDFEDMISAYRQNPQSMTRRDKEALVYAQQKVNRAQAFIDAVKQRQQTMTTTMKALIRLQKAYFLSGDDSDLRPMVLKDIADITHLDVSTISRVTNGKYAETPWGIIQLKSLFSNGFSTTDGEEVSTREIKNALRDLVSHEPKGRPLSDIRLAAELKKKGYPIARRTVAKYREQLGIPTSVLRK